MDFLAVGRDVVHRNRFSVFVWDDGIRPTKISLIMHHFINIQGEWFRSCCISDFFLRKIAKYGNDSLHVFLHSVSFLLRKISESGKRSTWTRTIWRWFGEFLFSTATDIVSEQRRSEALHMDVSRWGSCAIRRTKVLVVVVVIVLQHGPLIFIEHPLIASPFLFAVCFFTFAPTFRSIRPDGIDDTNRGPYVVGSYPPDSYLSQSSEHIGR